MWQARIQEFSSGGSTKKALTFFLFFFSPQLILQKSNGQFQRNLSFSAFQRGSNIFQGVQLFPGGSNCLFPLETHISCDFPGGSGPPVPPSGSALVWSACSPEGARPPAHLQFCRRGRDGPQIVSLQGSASSTETAMK